MGLLAGVQVRKGVGLSSLAARGKREEGKVYLENPFFLYYSCFGTHIRAD